MTSAKDLRVAPIASSDAREFVRKTHYSGKVANNSQLHLGVFLGPRLHGVMQFGPPLDKKKTINLVAGTKWNDFFELNRMAFDDALPRNSESRALSVAMRIIRKQYPNIEWVVSFADGTQCGDGTIYRASGFVLTQINKNKTIGKLEGMEGTISDLTVRQMSDETISKLTLSKGKSILSRNGKSAVPAEWKPLEGFQLRYVYFLNPEARVRLQSPILPFSAIDEAGARMYRGQRGGKGSADGTTIGEGGSIPTPPLDVK